VGQCVCVCVCVRVCVRVRLYSLWLSQSTLPQAHDESAMMEGASTLGPVLPLWVGDLNLGAALHVVDHVAAYQMGIQTLH